MINSGSDGYLIINEHNPSLPIYFDTEKHKYQVKRNYEDHPVVGVSWSGAALISYLLGGRLPFEEEWEYCAKSGNQIKKFPWGNDDPSKEKANYGEIVGDTTEVKK